MSDNRADEKPSPDNADQFRQLVNSLASAVMVVDEQGEVLFANRAATDMLGVSGEEAQNYHLTGALEPGERTEIEPPDAGGKVIAEGQESDIEWNGATAHVISLHYTGADKDVKRGMAEAQNGRTLFNSTGDAIHILDMEGNHLEVNDVACRRLGYSRSDLLNMNVHRIDARHGPAKAIKRLEEIRKKGSLVFESVHVTRDGRHIPIEINSKLIDYGGRPAVLNVARDISRRKEAERKKRRWRGFWHSSLDALKAHIAVLDEKADIIAVNSSWRVFADENGLEWEDYGVGRNYLEVAEKAADEEDSAAEAAAGIRQILAEKRSFFELEYPCHGPDTQRWFLMRCTSFGTGSNIRAVVAHQEITGRREAEERVREAYDKLRETRRQIMDQERQRALSQMASGIAHDFNNALSPIRGYAELLLQSPEKMTDSGTVKRYLEDMKKAADQAAETVRRMRKFYRPAEEWEHEPLNVTEVVQEAIDMTRPRWKQEAQAEGMTIEMDSDLQPVPPVKGNASELHEMLTNLIFNAVDAMEEDGRIRLTTAEEDQGVIIEVSDTGKGMDEETLQHCMDPFYTTKAGTGTGLGLSITQGIARRHGGDIEVESEPGKGTTFRIILPRCQEVAQERDTPEEATGKEAQMQKRALELLVVEDDETQRNMMSEILEDVGHNVDVAADGTEGLKKFSNHWYDAVLTDRAMPRVGGDQLSSMIKDEAPNKPVIMLTGFGDMMEATGEKPEHTDAVISKPVSREKLNRALKRALTAIEGKELESTEEAAPSRSRDEQPENTVESLIQSLHRRLHANDLAAEELANQLLNRLSGTEREDDGRELVQKIGRFEFAQARTLLRELAKKLAIPLKETEE